MNGCPSPSYLDTASRQHDSGTNIPASAPDPATVEASISFRVAPCDSTRALPVLLQLLSPVSDSSQTEMTVFRVTIQVCNGDQCSMCTSVTGMDG